MDYEKLVIALVIWNVIYCISAGTVIDSLKKRIEKLEERTKP